MKTLSDLVDFLSPSRLAGWSRCQQQWFYIWAEGSRRRPTASMNFGNAADRASNDVYMNKIAMGETETAERTRELWREHWQTEADQVEDWQGEDRGAMTDEGVAMIGEWRERVALHVKPLAVQKLIEVEVDSRQSDRDHEANERAGVAQLFRVRGYVDVHAIVDGVETFCDLKVGRKYWGAADFMRQLQPAAYSLAGVDRFQFHTLRRVRDRRKVVRVIARTVTATDRKHFVATAGIARRQIAHACSTGDFLPNRNQTLCSKRWCGFWRRCVQQHGGSVAD